MTEVELNVLIRQCLNGGMVCLPRAAATVAAWQSHRNNRNAKITWQFAMENARIKLRRLYPTEEM